METIKKLTLIAMLVSTTPLLSGCGAGFTIGGSRHQTNAREGFETAVGRTILASLAINTIAACTKDNFLPMKAFVPAAIIMGAGMGALGYLDDRNLKKNPLCKANKRNSRILQALVVAAGLTPIVLCDSQSGKIAREALKPVGEFLLSTGSAFLDAAAVTFMSGK